MQTELWAIFVVLVASIIGSVGALMIKKGAAEFSFHPLKLIKNYYVLIGAFLYGIGTILFIPALKHGELSVLYPFVSTSYIWVSILSMSFLGEKMNREKWLGIALIIVGVTLIGLGS
ncbi:MAG TPA: EamA family transporter [Candidatus Nanoarchaeia archaeon]|nr:EamA family transporter [Candidatus Nanoarchaeia archaeon]